MPFDSSMIPQRIVTPSLNIHTVSEADAYDIAQEIQGPSWDQMHEWVEWVSVKSDFEGELPHRRAIRGMERFKNGTAYFGVSRLKDTNRLGPQVTLYNIDLDKQTAEYGYWTPTGLCKKGLTKEASLAMVRLAHEHYGLKEIWARCAVENKASIAVLEFLGFEHSHTIPAGYLTGNGNRFDENHYVRRTNSRLPTYDITF